IREDETLENAQIRRQVYLELNEIVEIFNPKIDEFIDNKIEDITNKSNNHNAQSCTTQKSTKYNQIESTSSFSCVCNNHYHRWKRYKEKMKDMILNVTGVGKTNWFNYFQMIEYKLHNIPVGFQSITFGFLYPKLYVNGTKIYFQTPRNKPSIYISISEEIKNKLKYKNEVIGILNHIDLLSDPAAYFIDYKVKQVENKNNELEYEIIINPKYFWIACND
ncbi:MAG: hypothetical protein J5680_07865, partial [Neisseriaceae bacterium]|nr:hypothetical protein [Neisseriaceae bacterium]